MTRPRLTFVIPTLAPGGTERQLLHLANGLAQTFDVRVICTAHAGPWANRLTCPVAPLGCRSGWDLRMQPRVHAELRNNPTDIVHSFMFGFDYAVNAAARRADVPVVISSRRQLATWKRPRHIRLQRQANELVDAIVANAQAVADFARTQERGDAHLYRVIPNGIDAAQYDTLDSPATVRAELGLPTDAPVLGIVANFSPVKNHQLFLQIASNLARTRPDLHFLLVGDGALRPEIERAARRAGIAPRLRIVHDHRDAARCYRAMTVSMLCSDVEGFPNAALESMAAGVPFVGPAVGGIPELIDDGSTGFLVPGRSPAGFAKTIAGLLDAAEPRDRIAVNARAKVGLLFTVDAMIERYGKLFTELLAQKRSEAA